MTFAYQLNDEAQRDGESKLTMQELPRISIEFNPITFARGSLRQVAQVCGEASLQEQELSG